MHEHIAQAQGYTELLTGEAGYGCYSLNLLVKPDTDLDGRFKAWCLDDQCWLMVNGWNCVFDTEEEMA